MAAAEASRELALRSDEVPGTWYAVTITWVGRIIVTILVLLFTMVLVQVPQPAVYSISPGSRSRSSGADRPS